MTTAVLPIYDESSALQISTTPESSSSSSSEVLARRNSTTSLGSDGSSTGGSVVNGMGKEMDLVPIYED